MESNGYALSHPADFDDETSYTFTCGKIDAGIAVLIGSRAHLIEFPSLLLPPGCETGSIVSIVCTRDYVAEKAQADSFWDLQNKIFNQFGLNQPQQPNLRLRSVTQTSVTLEWDKLDLAQCKLLSLSIWKNGQRLGAIPNPTNNFSTKLSGLDLDTEYNFHLLMKTTGGSFSSKKITVKTHSLNDTSGINVCFGVVLPEENLEHSKKAIQQLNARWSDKIQIDTTHFVCTMPHHPQQNHHRSSQPNSFPSLEYQRALQASIPIVQPSWLLACLSEKKMVPIAAHYLGAKPSRLNSMPSLTSMSGFNDSTKSDSKTTNYSPSSPVSPKGTRSIPASPRSSSIPQSIPKSLPPLNPTSANFALPLSRQQSIEKTNSSTTATSAINPSLEPSKQQNLSEANDAHSIQSPQDINPKPITSVPVGDQVSVTLTTDNAKLSSLDPAINSIYEEYKQLKISNQSSNNEQNLNSKEPPEISSIAPDSELVKDSLKFTDNANLSTPKAKSKASHSFKFASSSLPNNGVEDGEEDPFSAASPSISNVSPLQNHNFRGHHFMNSFSPVTPQPDQSPASNAKNLEKDTSYHMPENPSEPQNNDTKVENTDKLRLAESKEFEEISLEPIEASKADSGETFFSTISSPKINPQDISHQ
ncbi:hypothetical protein O181_039862 [Austropuccinia psidii MF-1]|uniref:Fibronectin type-III domain-containing protein n=1 Tax=Austropuccinia psidii MF-1 TaxID=1389203 RepID=A0A9Q3DHM0_9BASI|nr:hypothetical protein [Austropuccinia psidii MF-1]